MKYPPKLQCLIDRHCADLEFSLQTSEVNGHDDYWDMFLQAIIIGCRRESLLLEAMEMICTTFEHLGEFPPLGIIQHALNPKLLEIYGANLADWLEKYLQSISDSTFLSTHPVLE